MKMIGKLFVVLAIVYIQACSTRQVYDSLQYSEKLKCQAEPRSEYAECMERTRESYDKYKEKRDDVLE